MHHSATANNTSLITQHHVVQNYIHSVESEYVQAPSMTMTASNKSTSAFGTVRDNRHRAIDSD